MRKSHRIFLLAFLSIQQTIAQSVVRSTVTDAAGKPLSGCRIALLHHADSAGIDVAFADTAGNFSFRNVVQGSYLLQVKHADGRIAFTPFSINGGRADTTLPVLKVFVDNSVLKNVTVSALRPAIIMKNGSLIMDVAHDPSAAGNTVIELLKRMPGVIVDAQNNVSVDGKAGVQFLMDGRLQQLPAAQVVLLLSNMPAEAVDAIELVRNPPAKYDAAGTGGLINIKSRKQKIKGFGGTVTESAGIGKRFGNGLNAALDFRADRLTLFTNVTYLERNPLADATLDRARLTAGGTDRIHSNTTIATRLRSVLLKGGLEYAISERTTGGISLSYAPTLSQDAFAGTTVIDAAGLFPYHTLQASTASRDLYSTAIATAYIQHRPDTNGTQLDFSVDYTFFAFGEARMNKNRFFDDGAAEVQSMQAYDNGNEFSFHILAPKLDFKTQLTQRLNLEAGVKAAFAKNSSSANLARNDSTGAFLKDMAFCNSFDYLERILAGYVSLGSSWRKVTVQAGLRAEHTATDTKDITAGTGMSRRYFNIFPNVSLNYKPGEKSSYQLTYSYRIDRPAYDQLQPYKVFNDPLSYSTGNPDLKPQYSHVATLDYSYSRLIFASLGYTSIRNSIYSYPVSYPGSSVQVDTVLNFAFRSLLSANIMLQRQPAKWYQVQLSGTVAYSNFRGTLNGADAGSSAVIGFVRLANDFALPAKMRLQLNASGSTPYRDAVQQYAARGTVDIALQRRFLKERLNAVLAVNDLLYTDRTAVITTLADQSYRYRMRSDTRRLRLTLTYRLGNTRIDRKVKTGPEEEIKRIKKAA